ncbi:hypothetical protein SAMN04487846_1733 [Microbacterium sp. cf046]|uniref:hypothetical protein n=1 Tax=Microbacterium sp. cf046 TaxID=1761803 RepID=UPI0008E598D4|nr:hypothetical protein [Microbacterium sp. cf046]SFS03982.1 hypothetical protein SAMN04487846_1733 [Microbacterium sp. cf046]
MGFLSKFRRRKNPYAAVTEEEQIARYVYLLNTLPASVIESAHAAAFKDLSSSQRREMLEQLRPFMSDAERSAPSDDPNLLAKLVRRAEERRTARAAAGAGPDAEAEASVRTTTATVDPNYVDPRTVMAQTGVMSLVAYQFLLTSSVSAYFTVGAGSLAIGDQPGWVGDTFDPGSAGGIDAAGAGGYDGGGGFDGGGFGGGFDGGGFGGGFDGGGGFG